MPVEYRRAVPADLEGMLAVVQAGFETYRGFAPPGWDPPDETQGDAMERTLAAIENPDDFVIVALDGDELAGHVSFVPARDRETRTILIPDLVHLRHLFVGERWWGTGIATRLHAAAVAEMRRRSWPQARLFTPELHPRARRFYEREGWRQEVAPFHEEKIGFSMVEYRLDLAG